jgi:hypothetical protein
VRALPALIALLFCLGALPGSSRAQESAYRFGITWAGDSTFSFPVARHGWVRSGLTGIAVDPFRRDALVARFRVIQVADGHATALITGQTTNVTAEHVALLDRPPAPWFRQRTFWIGTVLGVVVGAFVAGR